MRWDGHAGDGMGTWLSDDLLQNCIEYQTWGTCSHHHTGKFPKGSPFPEPKTETEAEKSIKLFFEEAALIGLEEASKRLNERIKGNYIS